MCLGQAAWGVNILLSQKDAFTLALVYLHNTVLQSVDGSDVYVKMLFSYLSKGFDLIDHNMLLCKMDNVDVDTHLVRWIVTFLLNRNQRVRVLVGRLCLHPYG